MDKELIIEVDSLDNEIGAIEKMEAHQKGVLHRAFSIFIFNSKKELLLQKRAKNKYHSGGLWTNTCCSHPHPSVPIEKTLEEKLMQEMGLKPPLQHQFHFIYRCEFDNHLIEHELDHVYFGFTDELPNPNPEEADDWKYMNMEDLKVDLYSHPDKYTVWLQICFTQVYELWKEL